MSVGVTLYRLVPEEQVQMKGEFFALVFVAPFFLLKRAPKCTFEAFVFARCPLFA